MGQSLGTEWGCFGSDIIDLPNISNNIIPSPRTEEGVRISDGTANTDAILMECSQAEIASLIVLGLYGLDAYHYCIMSDLN